MIHARFLLAMVLWSLAGFASAHEFWIEPRSYQVEAGDRVAAQLRIGEAFKGSTFSYNPRTFRRFDMRQAGTLEPVPGRAGDRPAVQVEATSEGLLSLIHTSVDSQLTYREFDKFVSFLEHKDWMVLVEGHRARGLPEDGFRERYSRYAKSLIAVGHGAGDDLEEGLATEIVALANPYTAPLDMMTVRVLFDGKPRTFTQVELFEKAPDNSVAVTLHRTDGAGVAQFPVKPGHSYLVDAVVIRAIEPTVEDGSVWESLWASLTFGVPMR